MAIELATFEQIATILTQLGTNYNNLFIDYFNIFYSNEPMDVTLQYYDETGRLQTITIPNRAKDRRFILNGEGAPEGSISGQAGALYQDLLNGNVYIKQVSASDVNGWEKIIALNELEGYISKGAGNPEGRILRDKGALYIDISTSSLYVKDSVSGNTGWILVSADTSVLADRNLSNLTTEGETVVKGLADLAISANATVQGKEEKDNKVQELTSGSTEVEYPSAKATYDFVKEEAQVLANTDLSNITSAGKALFIGSDKWSNGVLEASTPPTHSGNDILLSSGTKLLCASDSNKKNVEVTIPATPVYNITVSGADVRGVVFYDDTHGLLREFKDDKFYTQVSEPPSPVTGSALWYNYVDNEYKIYDNSDWLKVKGTVIAGFVTDDNGNIIEFTPCITSSVASMNDLRILKSKVDGTAGDLGNKISELSTLVNPIVQNGSLAANGLYIETTVDSSTKSWSRVYYTDNTVNKEVVWMEQGGTISTVSDQEVEVHFLLPYFSDTDFFIVKNFSSDSLSSVGMCYLGFYDKTVSTAKTRSMGSGYVQTWYACGK